MIRGSGLLGALILSGLFWAMFCLTPDEFVLYVNIPAFLVSVGGAFGAACLSYGINSTLRAFWCIRLFFVNSNPDEIDKRTPMIIKSLITYLYAFGLFGTFVGVWQVFAPVTEWDTEIIGPALCVASLTTLYSAFWAEFIMRPTLKRVEWLQT